MHREKQTTDQKSRPESLIAGKGSLLTTGLAIATSAIIFKAVILSVGLLSPEFAPTTATHVNALVIGTEDNLAVPTPPRKRLAVSTQDVATQKAVEGLNLLESEQDGRYSAVSASKHKSPSQLAKENARSALTIHLAKLKLKSALIAARNAAKQTKPIEISPAPNAVIALAGPTPAPETAETEVPVPPLVMASLQTEPLANIDLSREPLAGAPTATETTPVPNKRPRPLIHSKPGAITKPVKPSAPVLAYAAPGIPEDDKTGLFSGLGKVFKSPNGGLPGRSRGIAVYDISTATVHMPDGTKLEAHSGIGHRKDKPKYAYVKNLGPTPPNVYKLRMRERLFHGVEAIRMLPLDRAAMKGRDGMLAHTPLLRRTNGSHGCVAFKNYKKFLAAFKAGKVKTMIVVPSMNKLPTYMAKLERKSRV
ncbi:MAG: tlde1 domain-containing protein [Roseibium sp.]